MGEVEEALRNSPLREDSAEREERQQLLQEIIKETLAEEEGRKSGGQWLTASVAQRRWEKWGAAEQHPAPRDGKQEAARIRKEEHGAAVQLDKERAEARRAKDAAERRQAVPPTEHGFIPAGLLAWFL